MRRDEGGRWRLLPVGHVEAKARAGFVGLVVAEGQKDVPPEYPCRSFTDPREAVDWLLQEHLLRQARQYTLELASFLNGKARSLASPSFGKGQASEGRPGPERFYLPLWVRPWEELEGKVDPHKALSLDRVWQDFVLGQGEPVVALLSLITGSGKSFSLGVKVVEHLRRWSGEEAPAEGKTLPGEGSLALWVRAEEFLEAPDGGLLPEKLAWAEDALQGGGVRLVVDGVDELGPGELPALLGRLEELLKGGGPPSQGSQGQPKQGEPRVRVLLCGSLEAWEKGLGQRVLESLGRVETHWKRPLSPRVYLLLPLSGQGMFDLAEKYGYSEEQRRRLSDALLFMVMGPPTPFLVLSFLSAATASASPWGGETSLSLSGLYWGLVEGLYRRATGQKTAEQDLRPGWARLGGLVYQELVRQRERKGQERQGQGREEQRPAGQRGGSTPWWQVFALPSLNYSALTENTDGREKVNVEAFLRSGLLSRSFGSGGRRVEFQHPSLAIHALASYLARWEGGQGEEDPLCWMARQEEESENAPVLGSLLLRFLREEMESLGKGEDFSHRLDRALRGLGESLRERILSRTRASLPFQISSSGFSSVAELNLFLPELNFLVQRGEYDALIQILSVLIGLHPGSPLLPLLYSERGLYYLLSHDLDQALEDLNRAIELRSKEAGLYVNRGAAYVNKGDLDRAIADYNRAIELDPRNVEAHVNRGNAYAEKGDLDRAIADYNRAIELNPERTEAYYNRGEAYFVKGDFGRAIADFSRVIELDPEDAEAYYKRGLAYMKKGDLALARRDLRRFLELAPDHRLAPEARKLLQELEGE
ncbi:MAG: tetratricopeptide repeat protein [Thermus sp.]